jgi:hypothetical protein
VETEQQRLLQQQLQKSNLWKDAATFKAVTG